MNPPKPTRKKNSGRRWYDQDAGCTHLMTLLCRIDHPEIQKTAGQLLVNFAQRLKQDIEDRNKSGVQSMGLPALRAKYLARQQGRRHYDSTPFLAEAFGLLYQLPTAGLTALAFNLGDVFEMLVIYAFACKELKAEPDPKEVLAIIQKGLHEGFAEAKKTLTHYIGIGLYEKLSQSVKS